MLEELQKFMESISHPSKEKIARRIDHQISKNTGFNTISWVDDTCLGMIVPFKSYILGVLEDDKELRISSMKKINSMSKELRTVLIHFRKEYNNKKDNKTCDK